MRLILLLALTAGCVHTERAVTLPFSLVGPIGTPGGPEVIQFIDTFVNRDLSAWMLVVYGFRSSMDEGGPPRQVEDHARSICQLVGGEFGGFTAWEQPIEEPEPVSSYEEWWRIEFGCQVSAAT